MISRFLDVVLSPKTNSIYFWRHEDTSNKSREVPIHSHALSLEVSKFQKSKIKLSKRRVPNDPGDPSKQFLEILNMGSIPPRKHEMILLIILDQHISKHFETLNLWNFETLRKSDLGSMGVWGAISIVNMMKRIAQKLRRIILLHFGLVTFRFHYLENPKTHNFHDFSIFGRGSQPQN